MYLEAVDSATSKPSFRSSPWMRGAPLLRHADPHGSNSQERQVGDAGSSARPHMGFDVAKAGGDAQTLAVALCASADLPKPEYARNMALSGIPIRAAGRDIKTSVFLPLSMIIVFPTGEVACLAENGLELIYHRVAILARVGSRLENFGLVEEGI
jgi:hypothetical protein